MTGTTAQRVPWVVDGFTGTNASVMNPSKWGVVETPASVTYAFLPPLILFNSSNIMLQFDCIRCLKC